MAVVLTKTAAGNFLVEVTGILTYSKPFYEAAYSVVSDKIKIIPKYGNDPIMLRHHAPEEWTIDGVDGFTTTLEVAEAFMTLTSL